VLCETPVSSQNLTTVRPASDLYQWVAPRVRLTGMLLTAG